MIEYPKIDTLFERDKETFVVNPHLLKKPVFKTISMWDVTEKVDGTNIRVMYDPNGLVSAPLEPGPYKAGDVITVQTTTSPVVTFNRRTNNAKLPGDLLDYLKKTFTPELFADKFQGPITLYGEGYGAGIQKVGGLYSPTKKFILFDVLVDNVWWLDTLQVQGVAESLGIDVVPYLGCWDLDKIIQNVQTGFNSNLGDPTKPFPAEGVVARPIQTLFDSRHERVILKLKASDFKEGKR